MPDFLPAKFRFSHDYALFLHDILAQIVVHGERAGLFVSEFELKDHDQAEDFSATPPEAIWDWLEAHGYHEEIREIIYRQVIAALLSDFCHFVFEALSCSRKGKLTVAYSLLRKPFKDNLFYLEWLLADPSGFIDSFTHGGADTVERHRRERPHRFPIIEKAVSLIGKPGMFDATFIDEIRYDRGVEYGFAGTWDQANHLITTYSALRTSDQNFNFIFAKPNDEGNLDFLYSRLPMLLNYTVEVVEALIARILPQPDKLDDLTATRRSIGYILWAESLGHHTEEGETESIVLPDCQQCAIAVIMDKENMLSFYKELKITCRNCGYVHEISEEDEHPAE
jgi:hypothetical protein